MPRPRTPGVIRPSCPRGHRGGTVWLYGFYGRNGYHERPRFTCVPATGSEGRPLWRRHRFTETLPRRHGSPEHPLGKRCATCDHTPRPDEGPQTGRGFTFTVREAAAALVGVGQGLSYREASRVTRQQAWPARADAERELSRHGQLLMNYLDAFGDEIYARSAETSWPEALVLDALPQHEKDTHPGGAKKKGGRRAFSVLAAYGYREGKGKLWRLGVYGAEDAYEWERFLRTMPGQVGWVVCDQGGAIATAVKRVWPEAVIYSCEWHIATSGLRWVRPKELGDRYSEIVELVKGCTPGQAELDALGAALASLLVIPPALERWYVRQRRQLPALWAKRQPGMPRGTGALEHCLDRIGQALDQRRLRFRNLGRLERLLAMLLLHLNGEAGERRYASIIHDHLLRHGGWSASAVGRWRSLADPKTTGSSLRELVKQARLRQGREKALAAHRRINARAAAAWHRRQPREARDPLGDVSPAAA